MIATSYTVRKSNIVFPVVLNVATLVITGAVYFAFPQFPGAVLQLLAR